MHNQFSGDNLLELLDFLQHLTNDNIEDVIQDIRRDPNLDKSMQNQIVDLIRHTLKQKQIAQNASLI
jgi:hypothetical protein